MKYANVLCLIIMFSMSVLSGQAPDTLWTKTYGGASYDYAHAVQLINDGGYIIIGTTGSFGAGAYDFYFIKTDGNGDTLWTRTYGGSNYDWGVSVQQTDDGGYIITGRTMSYGAGDNDIYLIKTDASGDTLWTKTYGGTGIEEGWSVQQTTDDGYIIAGKTFGSFGASGSDAYLVKTDSMGDTLWTKRYGGQFNDEARSVLQTADGGYIVAGWLDVFGSAWQYWLLKTDSLGDTLWTKSFGGSNDDIAFCVGQTYDGGYVMVGYTTSFGAGNSDAWVVKTDSLGNEDWNNTYGGPSYDEGFTIHQVADSGYIIVGHTYSFGAGDRDIYLVKTSSSGDTLWTATFGGANTEYGYSVQQTTDNGYIVAGGTFSYGIGGDVYLIRTEPDGMSIQEPTDNSKRVSLLHIVPNPFTDRTTITYATEHISTATMTVYDVAGRFIADFVLPAEGSQSVVWNGTDQGGNAVQTGVYFIRVHTIGYSEIQKLLLIR